MRRRFTVYAALAALAVGILTVAAPASASVEGRRNTAAALTGAALAELLRGDTGAGLLLGAGAAYAWDRVNDAKRAREYAGYPYGYEPYPYGYEQYPYGYSQYPYGYRTYPRDSYRTYGGDRWRDRDSGRRHRDRDRDDRPDWQRNW